MNSTTIIIGMATTTVASAVLQIVLNGNGKQSEAMMVDSVTKCLLGVTAITTFAKVVKAIATL